MGKYLQFGIENVDFLEERNDSQFATAKIQAFSSDRNLHDLFCSEEVLKETASTIYNKPVLYTIDKSLDDFYTHVSPEKSLICGFVLPDSAEFVRLPDNRLSLTVVAKIWKKYSPKVIELFKRDKKSKRVSVEMEVFELKDRPDGLTDMLSFAYAGICLLGDFVREASPGANIQMLSFSEDKKEYEQAYIEEFASRYDELNFDIPKNVKENSLSGLELYKTHGVGGTSVSIATARHLTKNEKSNPEKIRSLLKYFSRHIDDDLEDKSGKNWISWQLWGGNDGFSWSKKLVESMNKIDERKTSYFAQDEIENGKSIEKNKEENMSDEVKKPEEMATESIPEEGKPMPVDLAETPAEDKKEEQEEKEEEKEEKKEEMSEEKAKYALSDFASNLVTYMEDEAGEDEEFARIKMAVEEVKKEGTDFATIIAGMYAKMCKTYAKMEKMAEEKKVSDEEMSALKEFKASVEAQQKQFAIEETLSELDKKVIIPEDARTEMVKDADNYTFSNIDIWKNNCKAKSFDFTVRTTDKKEEKVKRYAFPFNTSSKQKTLWEKK